MTGKKFVTPSGRRWVVSPPSRFDGANSRRLVPLGADTYSGGGVRSMRVHVDRLDGTDKVWKPVND